jgi:N-acyl homoserine lactone hydrolase
MSHYYRIRPLVLSSYKGEKGIMTFLEGYGQQILRPFIMWAILGTDFSLIVDTAIEADDYNHYHPAFRNIPMNSYMSFEEALNKVGMTPDSVDVVVQTHLHFDHCYNTKKCSKAMVVVQKDEVLFAKNPIEPFKGIYRDSLIKDLNIKTIDGDYMLAPGIELLKVPGHSPGCQAVSVATKIGKVVISGFCSIKENFFPEEGDKGKSPMCGYPVKLPGIFVDATKAYESLIRIKERADMVLPLHDPGIIDVGILPET